MDAAGLWRFARYAAVGVSTLGLDLTIVYLLVTVSAVPYSLAIAIGFAIGISVNYVVSRLWVFRGTLRSLGSGYAYFVGAGGSALAATVLLTTLLVELTGAPLLPARIAVAGVVGAGNYLFNLYFNFNVAGKHE